MNDRFDLLTTHRDGSTIYSAPHELYNEVMITFPPGYWRDGPVPINIAFMQGFQFQTDMACRLCGSNDHFDDGHPSSKKLPLPLREKLQNFLYDEAMAAENDSPNNGLLSSVLWTGGTFKGYKDYTDEELVTELSEVDWEDPDYAASPGARLWKEVSAVWEAQ